MEQWRDIYYFNAITNTLIDYRGLYQVSDQGGLRSVDRYVRGFNHGIEHKKFIKGKVIKCRPNRNGYILAHLSKGGKHFDYSLHRLVYFSFNPEADTTLTVNHKNEVISDNRLENLELLSMSANINYGTRNNRLSAITKEKRKKRVWNNRNKPNPSSPFVQYRLKTNPSVSYFHCL